MQKEKPMVQHWLIIFIPYLYCFINYFLVEVAIPNFYIFSYLVTINAY